MADIILQPEINQISRQDFCPWAQAEDSGIEWLKQKEFLGDKSAWMWWLKEGDLSIKGVINRQSWGSNDLIQAESPMDQDLRSAMPNSIYCLVNESGYIQIQGGFLM